MTAVSEHHSPLVTPVFSCGHQPVITHEQHAIKIDRCLIEHIETDPTDLKFVEGTVSIAAGLSVNVIAEGVENEQQAELMRSAGCGEIQGFHFYRPMPADEVSLLVATALSSVNTAAA